MNVIKSVSISFEDEKKLQQIKLIRGMGASSILKYGIMKLSSNEQEEHNEYKEKVERMASKLDYYVSKCNLLEQNLARVGKNENRN